MKMLGRNRRKNHVEGNGPDIERSQPEAPRERPKRGYNHNGHKISRGIEGEGESGRKGIHPWHFIRIGFKSTSKVSMLVNILWPFVPPAIAIHFARPALHEWIFALNYVAMVPTANLLGFAGQELARKVPNVLGN
jgi:Ca2+:H+ antiporter